MTVNVPPLWYFIEKVYQVAVTWSEVSTFITSLAWESIGATFSLEALMAVCKVTAM